MASGGSHHLARSHARDTTSTILPNDLQLSLRRVASTANAALRKATEIPGSLCRPFPLLVSSRSDVVRSEDSDESGDRGNTIAHDAATVLASQPSHKSVGCRHVSVDSRKASRCLQFKDAVSVARGNHSLAKGGA
jgi:hypothetical protein